MNGTLLFKGEPPMPGDVVYIKVPSGPLAGMWKGELFALGPDDRGTGTRNCDAVIVDPGAEFGATRLMPTTRYTVYDVERGADEVLRQYRHLKAKLQHLEQPTELK